MAQHDGRALAFRQAFQCLPQRLQLLCLLGGIGWSVTALMLVFVFAADARLVLAQVIDAQIVCDAVQPGAHTGFVTLPAVCMRPQAQEGFLRDVLGILAVAQHAEGEVTDGLQILPDGGLIRFRVTGLNRQHQPFIVCHNEILAP